MSDLLRLYLDPDEIGRDGYPIRWHKEAAQELIEAAVGPMVGREQAESALRALGPFRMSIKDYVRQQAGYRCERCGHPYPPGITDTCPRGEWTPCDEHCTHGGPMRGRPKGTDLWFEEFGVVGTHPATIWDVQAQWRILTVHHLNGIKHDCRWWNLTALCQRCHLSIQGRVLMERIYPWEHSEWFKPHAAGWYAFAYLGEDLSREETMERLDELLDHERDYNAQKFGAYTIAEHADTTEDRLL